MEMFKNRLERLFFQELAVSLEKRRNKGFLPHAGRIRTGIEGLDAERFQNFLGFLGNGQIVFDDFIQALGAYRCLETQGTAGGVGIVLGLSGNAFLVHFSDFRIQLPFRVALRVVFNVLVLNRTWFSGPRG